MIHRSVRLLHVRSAVLANSKQAVCKTRLAPPAHTVETLMQGESDRGCHRLAGELGQLASQSVRLFVLDIKAQLFLPFHQLRLPF